MTADGIKVSFFYKREAVDYSDSDVPGSFLSDDTELH